MALHVPSALKKAAIHFELMFARPTFDFERAIDRTVSAIDKSERQSVINFFEHVLEEKYNAEQMRKIWNSIGSGVYIPNDGGVKNLFEQLLARLKE